MKLNKCKESLYIRYICGSMKLSEIKPNPKNPRVIKDDKFAKLKKSIEEFPKMMDLRPMVLDSDNVVLGGNMRLRALQDLGYKEVPDNWVKKASELTEEEKQRFIITDNNSFGAYEWGAIANEWSDLPLADWGLDVPGFDVDYSSKNEEIEIDALDESMTIKLNYTEEEYWQVKKQLAEIAATPEAAVWKLLGNE